MELVQHPSLARIAQHVGEILLLYRTRRGYTQAFVAKSVGLKQASSIARFEQGKSSPSLDTLIRLTMLLEIDPNKFFHGLVLPAPEDPSPTPPPLSMAELEDIVEPFRDPNIRRVVANSLHQLDDPEAADFVEGLIDHASAPWAAE